MSLYKAYEMVPDSDLDYDKLKELFLEIVDTVVEQGKADKTDVIGLVSTYASFSCLYLLDVSSSLEDDLSASATMKFMNSYIAETVHKAGLHYYNKEHGYSIIDKAVQAALDDNGYVSTSAISGIIDEIEESYIEEPEPELEEE